MGTSDRKTTVLIVLDGWGYREETRDNAIALGNTPVWDRLWQQAPHTLISGSGLDVGLPDGQMGNSEVGHMSLGSGRVIYQNITRIDQAIQDGSFNSNPAYCGAIDKTIAAGGAVHVFGLLSPGGVHSHEQQIFAAVRLAAQRGAGRVYLHAFLDGRDTPPRSAGASLEQAQALFAELGCGRVASITGRYYAMDRDNNWDRIEKAYNLLTEGRCDYRAATALDGLKAAYERDENDEFVMPTVIASSGEPAAVVADNDCILFMNFRADRARELTRAFIEPGFNGFTRQTVPALSDFVMTTEYAADIHTSCAFAPQSLDNVLADYLAQQGMTQLRIAETEKYAHVTFFFSGGREEPFPGEDRELIKSPAVATYDLQPEMSAPELTDKLVAAIHSGKYDLIVCNYANGDMVGHTGILAAAIKATEALDTCLGRVEKAVLEAGGEALVTADHGNCEQMLDYESGQQHTQHTTDLVPLVYVGKRALQLDPAGGRLADIAPTLLAMMGLPQPPEMSGVNLARIPSLSTVPLRRFALLALLLAVIPGAVCGETDEKAVRSKLEQLQNEIKRIGDEISSDNARKNDLQQQLREAELQLGKLRNDMTAVELAIATSEKELVALRQQRPELEEARAAQQARIALELKAAWQLGQQSQVKVLLNQEDPHTVARAMAYYRYFFQARNELVANYRETLRKLRELEQRIADSLDQLSAQQHTLEEQQAQLATTRANREQAVAELNASISSKAGQLKQMERDRKELEALIAAIEKAVGELELPDDYQPFKTAQGKMSWPLDGKRTNNFGRPRNEGKMRWQGVTIPAKEGTSVKAIHHGRVVYADWLRGSGLLMIIDHGDGYMSLYAHNQSLLREVGEWVTAGTPVSTVGNSGGQEQSALYFEIRHNGKPTNPANWCKG